MTSPHASMPSHDPNWPADLRIVASTSSSVRLAAFDSKPSSSGPVGDGEEGKGKGREVDEVDEQAEQDVERYGIAGRTWEAAYLLRHYLMPPAASSASPAGAPRSEFDPSCPLFTSIPSDLNRTIVEIGSGTGYLSLALLPFLRERDRLVVTDLAEVCPLLESNLSRRRHTDSTAQVWVRPLPWGNPQAHRALQEELDAKDGGAEGGVDIVMASDLVYFPFLYPGLLRTLIWLTQAKQKATKVMVGYKIRSLTREEPFWKAFGVWFEFEPVFHRSKPTSSSKNDAEVELDSTRWHRFGETSEGEDQLFIFVGTRRPESFEWTVPEEDEKLMRGMGADDQFERLLMMAIEW